jgi:Domain of unknown function (DUF1929)
VRRLTGMGSGRVRVLIALAIAGIGAATIGLSPVMAGKNTDKTRYSSAFEAGFADHGFAHLSTKDVRGDKLRAARCAVPGYREAFPSKCPALSPKLRRSEARQRALCAKPVYRKRHPLFCPRITVPKANRAFKRALELNITGRWDPNLVQIDGLAINSTLLPTGKILWYAYPEKPNFAGPTLGDGSYPGSPANEAAINAATNWAEAYVFDPATGTSVRRDPPTDPTTGKPYNLWCSGQVMLRDGRVLVAGGNLAYYTLADPKYKGHYVVLTFNPFNETWTVQPRMRHGRWYPTLTELSDGRVVIVAGLDEEPLGQGDSNNTDIEVFTPSPNLDGVGSIQLVKEGQGFGLYPHVFLNGQGKLIVVGPDEEDSRIIDPTNWSVTPTQFLPSYGAQGGRREWGAAVMLPSPNAEAPSTIMMIGGSDAEDDHYNNPDQTNTTLLVNMANGGITNGAPNIRKRSHVNTTILPDGSLFTNGGGAGSIDGDQYAGPVFTGELLNPGASAWIETDPAKEERTYHSTSLLLPDGRVATMGDDRTENSRNRALRTVEYYEPPYLHKGARPTITSAPAGTPYGVPVGIGTPDAIAKAVIIKLGSTTHALDTSQRSLTLSFAAAPGGISVTMPSSANAAPPGYYQLFLLNAAGVPSMSKFIRIDTGLPVPSAVPVIPGPPGGGAAALPAPKISKLKATVKFKKGFATVKLSFKASKAFKGTVKLFPIAKAKKGSKAKLIKKPIVSKSISGAGTKLFAATIRFSVKGKRFPLKLRMTIALKDKRGGTTRTTTKGLLLIKTPKPKARILARAR